MTANIHVLANRKIPHTCSPYRLWGFAARPGDIRECPHGRIYLWRMESSNHVWWELEPFMEPITYWRARRALNRNHQEPTR